MGNMDNVGNMDNMGNMGNMDMENIIELFDQLWGLSFKTFYGRNLHIFVTS